MLGIRISIRPERAVDTPGRSVQDDRQGIPVFPDELIMAFDRASFDHSVPPCLEAGPPNMLHARSRHYERAESRPPRAKTPIGVLAEHEEVLIHQPGPLDHAPLNHERSSVHVLDLER